MVKMKVDPKLVSFKFLNENKCFVVSFHNLYYIQRMKMRYILLTSCFACFLAGFLAIRVFNLGPTKTEKTL